MKNLKNIFRAYDIRGTYPDKINGKIAYKIAIAFANKLNPKTVAVGKDMRSASDDVCDGIINGLLDSGVNVKNMGQITNPMLGFSVWKYGLDGGIIASASHDAIGYAGIKMMSKNAITVAGNDPEIKNPVLSDDLKTSDTKGKIENLDIKADYLKFLLSFIDAKSIKPLKVFINPFFGSIGLIIKDIIKNLPIKPIYFQAEPTKDFGKIIEPDPLTKEIRTDSITEFKKSGSDFGTMWDGDGDRCFFIDENGDFINAPYITALISKHILEKYPNSKIVGDSRIIWPIQKSIKENNGKFIESKAGYKFIKEKMAKVNAILGAEMSGHYFFKSNHNCDNGIIPLFWILEILSQTDKKLSQLVAPYKQGHFMIDEIEIVGKNFDEISKKLKSHFTGLKQCSSSFSLFNTLKRGLRYFDANHDFNNYKINETDGLTVEADDFRFNIRPSNTEPDIKLNIEAKSKKTLDQIKTEVLKLI